MNEIDSTPHALKIIVERAVRPVFTRLVHKRKLREELLAHVNGIYADELARRGNEAAAIEAARERFGPPEDLAAELAHGISRRQRVQIVFENLNWKPGDSLAHAFVKHVLLAVAMFLLVLAELTVVWFFPGVKFPYIAIVRVSFGAAVGTSLFIFGVLWFSRRIRQRLYGDLASEVQPPPNWRRAAPYLFVSSLLFPLAAFLLFWIIVGDFAGGLRRIPSGCLFAPVLPALFLIIARAMDQEQRYETQWARLDLDEILEA
jgi:hypothetical protein